jgi:hypothetical protein
MPDPADILLERLRRALTPEFEVERELGAGGMGVVFLGRDTALDMPVAIKVLRPELATAVAAERFPVKVSCSRGSTIPTSWMCITLDSAAGCSTS